MIVKQEWNTDDFDSLNWHDSFLYSMSFPSNEQKLSFDIDYIFKWEVFKYEDFDGYKFWVSPCRLIFHDVMFLKISLDFKDYVGVQIKEINRIEKSTPNIGNERIIWNFEIITEVGVIYFEATGFSLCVLEQPRLSDSQAYNKNE